MQVLGVDRASLTTCSEQFGARRIPVDHDVRGNLIPLRRVRRDLEHIVDGGVFTVDSLPWPWVDAWLWARWRGGMRFVFLLVFDPRNLRIDIALDQRVDDVIEGGGRI